MCNASILLTPTHTLIHTSLAKPGHHSTYGSQNWLNILPRKLSYNLVAFNILNLFNKLMLSIKILLIKYCRELFHHFWMADSINPRRRKIFFLSISAVIYLFAYFVAKVSQPGNRLSIIRAVEQIL